MMIGDPPDRAIKAIAKQFGASRAQAGRLIMTESAYFGNLAQKDAYKECGVQEVEILETLDAKTCPTCGRFDGARLELSKVVIGETAPPYHPNCRGCIAPFFDDMEGERIARGADGETFHVPSGMNFEEWKEKQLQSGAAIGEGMRAAEPEAQGNAPGDEASGTDKKDLQNGAEDIILNKSAAAGQNAVADKAKEAEERINDARGYVVEYGKKTGNEKMYVLNIADGENAAAPETGTRSEIKLSAETVEVLRNKPNGSLIAIHNHPGGRSFSIEDVALVVNYPSIRDIEAIGHNGYNYLLSIGSGERENIAQILGTFKRYSDELAPAYKEKVNTGKMSATNASREHTHKVLEKLSATFKWTYRREK